jgi:branched-chain amino acid transport system permease protein
MANIFALFTLSWNFISGQTSYISFGHSFLIGAAGYTTGILTAQYAQPMLLSIPLSIGFAMVAGLLIFVPTIRLRGVYFTFVTIAITIVAESIVIQQSDLTGGSRGLVGIPTFSPDLFVNYYLSALLVLLVAALYWLLMRSDLGTIIRMIRESEELAENSGIRPFKFKLTIFLMSAFVAGVAGSFQVHYLGVVTIDSVLYLTLAINIVIAAVIGGRGSTAGAIGGAYFFILSDAFLQPFLETPVRRIIFFSLGILIVALYPKGLVPSIIGRIRKQTLDGDGENPEDDEVAT